MNNDAIHEASAKRGWRWGGASYDHKKELPISINLKIYSIQNKLQEWKALQSKYFFMMDEGYFRIVDPAGFGEVFAIERGLITKIEISANTE